MISGRIFSYNGEGMNNGHTPLNLKKCYSELEGCPFPVVRPRTPILWILQTLTEAVLPSDYASHEEAVSESAEFRQQVSEATPSEFASVSGSYDPKFRLRQPRSFRSYNLTVY
jgi:hypothetical protein